MLHYKTSDVINSLPAPPQNRKKNMYANNQTKSEKIVIKQHQPRLPFQSNTTNTINSTPIPSQYYEPRLHSRSVGVYDTKNYEIIIVNLEMSNDSVQNNKIGQLRARTDEILNAQNIQLHPEEHTSTLADKQCQLNTSIVSVLNADQCSVLSSVLSNVSVQCKKKRQFNSSFAIVMRKQKQRSSIVPVQLAKFIKSAKTLTQFCKAKMSCPARFQHQATKVVNSKHQIVEYSKAKNKCPTFQRAIAKLNNSMLALLQSCEIKFSSPAKLKYCEFQLDSYFSDYDYENSQCTAIIESVRQVKKYDLINNKSRSNINFTKCEISEQCNYLAQNIKNCEFKKYISTIPEDINSQLRSGEHDTKLDNKKIQFSTSIAPVLQSQPQLPINASDTRYKSCLFNTKTALVLQSQSQLSGNNHQYILDTATVLHSPKHLPSVASGTKNKNYQFNANTASVLHSSNQLVNIESKQDNESRQFKFDTALITECQKQLPSIVSDIIRKRCQFNTSTISVLSSSNQRLNIESKQDNKRHQFKFDSASVSQSKNQLQLSNSSVYERQNCQFSPNNSLVMKIQNQLSGIVPALPTKFIKKAKTLPEYCKTKIKCPERVNCYTTKVANSMQTVFEYCKAKIKCPTKIKRMTTKLSNSIQTLLQTCKTKINFSAIFSF